MQALKDYLALTGMTQDQLARKAKIQPSAINHFIAGRREPRIKNLRKLSEATGISIENLIRGM